MRVTRKEIERIATDLAYEGYIPPTIWEEDRERVLQDLERIFLNEKDESSLVRIRWNAPTASGRRTGWAKTVNSVDDLEVGTKAFNGDYLKDNTETDLPVGQVVIEIEPMGSVKNNWQSAKVGVVTLKGLEFDDISYNWKEEFLSFKDAVKERLKQS